MIFADQTIGQFLGTVGVTLAAALPAAYFLFRNFGEKWLDSKFSESLEAYKHTQQQELEHLRFKINKTFDWTVKLNAHEFEILPRLWELINEAYYNVIDITASFQEYPDLNKSSPTEISHILQKSDLPDYQQQEIVAADDKTKLFINFIFWPKFKRVSETFRQFDRYAETNAIFLQPELIDIVKQLRKLMLDALVEKESEQRDPYPRAGRWEKCESFRKDGPDIRGMIERAIQARLWSSSSV